MTDQPATLGLRQRLIRGAGAQAVAHVARVLIQLMMGGVLLPAWGLQLYGEWLILVGAAVFLAGSDFGFISATNADMIMAVARGDRDHALDGFRTVARGLAVVFAFVFLVVVVIAVFVPLVSVLRLKDIDHASAAAILLMISVQMLLLISTTLLYGGFCCEGRYGEGILIQTGITAAEISSACLAAVLGAGPVVATAALLAARLVGTICMYAAMRRRAPWLSVGRPSGRAQVRKRLTRPALSLASIGWGTVLNVQVMTIIVGVATGAASAAIFATVRTLSRVVVQLTGSIGQAVGPELSKGYAEGRQAIISMLQCRVNQATIWISAVIIFPIAVFGDVVLRVWTRGHINHAGLLLDLLLLGAALEGAWLNAGAILFFTNRHGRIGLTYAIVSVVGLPLAFVMADSWGRNGAAFSVLLVSVLMLSQVLRLSLPAVQGTLRTWVRSLVHPASVWQAVTSLRTQFGARGS